MKIFCRRQPIKDCTRTALLLLFLILPLPPPSQSSRTFKVIAGNKSRCFPDTTSQPRAISPPRLQRAAPVEIVCTKKAVHKSYDALLESMCVCRLLQVAIYVGMCRYYFASDSKMLKIRANDKTLLSEK